MTKRVIKFFNFLAIGALWLNQLLVPMTVLAQEATGSAELVAEVTPTAEETPTPTEASPSPTETPEETEEEVLEDEDDIEEVEIIVDQNEASVSAQTVADSETGENTAEASSSAEIETGPAVAQADAENQINQTNTSIEPIEGEVVVVIPKQIVNDNKADLDNETSASADSGNNEIVKTEVEAEIDSGDAVATANVVNMVNTNIVGGKIGVYINNQFSGEKKDLDLNQMWQDLSEQEEAGLSPESEQLISVCNFNQATVENWVTVMASTGMNVIGESDEAVIMSGSATALANVINLVNTNIIGSQIFFGVLNINGALLADLILPAPSWFETTTKSQGMTISNSNQTNIDNQVGADANSGGNKLNATETGLIKTGQAVAMANSVTVANMEIKDDNYFYLAVNNLGGGQGSVYNWSSPGAVEELPAIGGSFSNWGINNGSEEMGISVYNQNEAYLLNNVMVSANSGGNVIGASQNGVIETGSATALANLNNFVNLNLSGNNWFYGVVNIVGGWNGRVIFAYPDLAVEIIALNDEVVEGEKMSYLVNYQNIGYDTAPGAEIELNIPEKTGYVSDNSGLGLKASGRNLVWQIGDLTPGQGGSFVVEVLTGVVEKLAWWQKIIKPATAAEVRIDAETRAVVRNRQVESDTSNNQAVASSKIVVFEEDGQVVVDINGENSGEYDGRQAELVIEAKNNVNDGVYPEDVVTFEIGVENRAAVSAYDSYLRHEIYDQNGELYRWAEIDLGEIKGNRKGKVNFGVIMIPETKAGQYYTQTVIYAWDQNGKEIESNWSETEFSVKSRYGTVMATSDEMDESEGEVAGMTTDLPEVVSPDKDSWFLYAALLFESSIWIYHQMGKWKKTKKINVFEVFYLLFVTVSFVFSVVMLFSITALAQINPF